MVDANRARGFARNIGGNLQDTVGGLTGDISTQARGEANQAAGEAQNMFAQIVDEVRGFTSDQPFSALLAAMGVGIAIGVLVARQ